MDFLINWLKSANQGTSMPASEWLWQGIHLWTFIACIGLIITLALIFKNKSEKARRNVVFVLAGIILFLELARRVINFAWRFDGSIHNFLAILLARPWCAISCWLLIICVIVNKKFSTILQVCRHFFVQHYFLFIQVLALNKRLFNLKQHTVF